MTNPDAAVPPGRERARSRIAPGPWLAIAAGFGGAVLALRLLADDPGRDWLASAILAVALVALAAVIVRSRLPIADMLPCHAPRVVRLESAPPLWLVVPAVLATVAASARRLDAGSGPVGWDVGAPWLIGITLCGLAAWWPVGAQHRFSGAGAWWPPTLVRGTALALLALAVRILWPGRYPTVIDGDEGAFLRMAREARTGEMANPFATGWFEAPNLYPAAMGWLTHLTGTSLAGYRALGALVGAVTVLATWRFGRRVVGEPAALAGSALLAVLPFHLLFSRSALIHVTDPASLVLALLFLRRAVDEGRRGDAWLAGVMVGLGWYGYWGARIYPVVVLLLLAIAATDRRAGPWRAIVLGAWATIGFLVTTAPLLMTFVRYPPGFRGRFDTTSLATASSWREDPTGTLRLFRDNLWEASLLPFVDNRLIFYFHEAPYLGWPMALLVAAGIAAVLAALARTRAWRTAAWLLAPWAVLTVGVATTYPVQPQRLMAMTPLWTLAAGAGLVLAVRWLTLGPVPALRRGMVREGLLAGAVVVLAVANLTWFMSEERQLDTYGDLRTIAAWDIGWRLGDGGPPVLLAGAPHMFGNGWLNLDFLAPDAELIDVEEPLTDTVPELPVGTILLIVPERAGELCAVVTAYPEVTVAEVRAWNGALLYLALNRGGPVGWSTMTTPAATTYTVVEPVSCESDGREGEPAGRTG